MALPKKIHRDLDGAPDSVRSRVAGVEELMGETMPVTRGQPPADVTIFKSGEVEDGVQVWICRNDEHSLIFWDWVMGTADGDDGRGYDITPPSWAGGPA